MIHQGRGADRFGGKTTPIRPPLVNIGNSHERWAILVTTRIVSMNPSGGPMIDYNL